MKSDLFLINIPKFNPEYEEGKLYSYDGKGKENLKNVLTKASQGYCMYCYTKILVDRKNFGQLEHSIEKFNSKKFRNCVSNISITCSKCNGSFKKRGEKIRKLESEDLLIFENSVNCSINCVKACSNYLEIKGLYSSLEEAQIILQPFGIKGKETNNTYLLQYDILNQKFIVNKSINYINDERVFIEKHINRFNLNDSEYRTKELLYFIEDILEYKTMPKKRRYNNLIVDLFIDQFNSFPIEKILSICEIISIQCNMRLK